MHPAIIALLGTLAVFLTLIVNGAMVTCRLVGWSCYEHCFSPPPDERALINERKWHMRRAGRFMGATFVLWLSTLSILALESAAVALIIGFTIMSLSAIPFCRASEALSIENGLHEADVRLYRKLDAKADHQLVRAYLDAVRRSGRGWVSKIEVKRLSELVREDDFRTTRKNSLSRRTNEGSSDSGSKQD